MSHKKQLSALVGFTDRTGCTSCAQDETEHYRLRTLGLVRVVKSARERSYKNTQWLLLWHSRNRFLEATSSDVSFQAVGLLETPPGDGRQGRVSQEEIERCKVLMVTKKDSIPRLESKQAHAEAELKAVLPLYSDFIHPGICSQLCAKLPWELRNMVYSYFDICTDDIQVEHSTRGTDGVPTSPFFGGDCSAYAWDKPWYLDASCVGPDLARELVELQYSSSKFCLNDHALIPRLLYEDRWKTGAVPRNHVRKIELEILDEQEFENENEEAEKLLTDHFRLLRQLCPGARLSINLFNLRPSVFDGSQRSESQSDGKRVASGPSPRAGHAMSIYAKLAPVLRDLEEHGHTVAFVDKSSRNVSPQ